jgi:hypothetical protein
MAGQAALSDVQVLTAVLTIEGFLLATVSLAAALGAPGRSRQPALPLSAFAIACGAAGLAVLVGSAGVVAWAAIYGEGEMLPLAQAWIALVILLVVICQPALAILLALGTRTQE